MDRVNLPIPTPRTEIFSITYSHSVNKYEPNRTKLLYFSVHKGPLTIKQLQHIDFNKKIICTIYFGSRHYFLGKPSVMDDSIWNGGQHTNNAVWRKIRDLYDQKHKLVNTVSE